MKVIKTKFPFFRQRDRMDCGPTCLKMICAYYGKDIALQELREMAALSREGVSAKGITVAAESLGFRVLAVQVPTFSNSEDAALIEAPLPCIVHWDTRHFVVVYKMNKRYVWIADPASGRYKIEMEKFQRFYETDNGQGYVILFEPTDRFYQNEFAREKVLGLRSLIGYFRPYRRFIVQLMVAILVSILLQLTFPFLTQSIIDVGVVNSDLRFIAIVLLAQVILFSFSSIVNIMQRWILLHMNTRISVQLVHDFLFNLMRLPVHIFDSKHVGDLYQRIYDSERVESFLSVHFIPLVLGLVNFLVFGLVLFFYNRIAFLIYMIGLALYIGWIVFFMKKRKKIDYLRFQESTNNQSAILELLNGMHEIKIQNSGLKRRNLWLNIQAKLFKINIKSLLIRNYQDFGGQFINQIKDILIIFVCARDVIMGQMTLGMLLAVQYITGQMNVPLNQLIGIFRSGQDASLSLARMNDTYDTPAENQAQIGRISMVPDQADLVFQQVDFKYNELSDLVLKDISLTIPAGKTTAIVGTSGSGKTTLIKLLLGFYEPVKGNITVGHANLSMIDKTLWRSKCGAVMQEGYIFSDSIANNIAESSDTVDKQKLLQAVQVANIQEFIEELPLGYNTPIGARGNGISLGQRQRLLIARAIYKEPDILFFDEATNALDANNERVITDNLAKVTKEKTVVVVAHRLSTVKHADQIIVLDKGRLLEKGTHKELVKQKGAYFQLVKNQLELGQ